MKISKPVKKEYDDDGLLPLVNIIFSFAYILYDCRGHRTKS